MSTEMSSQEEEQEIIRTVKTKGDSKKKYKKVSKPESSKPESSKPESSKPESTKKKQQQKDSGKSATIGNAKFTWPDLIGVYFVSKI